MDTSGGLALPGGGDREGPGDTDGAGGAVSLARAGSSSGAGPGIGPGTDWDARRWDEARGRASRAARAYVWLNLVEQRLRSVVGAVLRPVYEPVHGEEWVVAAAGPAGHEWVQRAAAVREVSRRKGYLLDPDDDNVLSFLSLPQLRELVVQHWPCFEPYLSERRELELVLDELEVARHVVGRNRALSPTVLAQSERAAIRLIGMLGGDRSDGPARRLPVDAVEQIVGDRYADVVGVHPDRVRLLRTLPAEELFGGARRLDAIGIGLNLLVQNYSGRRLLRLVETGSRVRLLFLNPASSTIRRRERELGLSRGELSRGVETNIIHMRRVRARLRDQAALEIRVYDETPRFTAYLVDGAGAGAGTGSGTGAGTGTGPGAAAGAGGDGIAVVQSYLRRARGMEAPVLVLRAGRPAAPAAERRRDPDGDREGGLFEVYREEFEGVWADSRPVS